jgi:VanZ family protein
MIENRTGTSASAGLRLGSIWYWLGILMLLLVAILSLMPAPDTGVSDKLAHTVTYFILAGWFSLLAGDRTTLCWSFAGLVVYGILIELMQGTTDYRFAEWGDVIANGIGTAAGMLLYFTPLPRVLRFIDYRLARIFLQ